jgi:hypothetical protein
MALYAAGKLRSEAAAKTMDEALVEAPAKILKNCRKYLQLESDEELILIADETLLGSGKEGVAVTSLRILSYDKSKLKLNLGFRGLEEVKYAELAYDAYGLQITRSGGRALKLRINHATKDQAQIVAWEIQSRLGKEEVSSAWQCPKCGPGEVIFIPEVRYTGPSMDAQIALTARDLSICRACGLANLHIEDPALIKADAIPGAELRRSSDG